MERYKMKHIEIWVGGNKLIFDNLSYDVFMETPNWSINLCGTSKYVRRADGKYLHRLLVAAPEGVDVDHINGNGLDNRYENLRLATRQQNIANKRMSKNNTSGYKGVSWCKSKQKWRAVVKVCGSQLNLGYFDSPELAHQVYLRYAKIAFGDFHNGGSQTE